MSMNISKGAPDNIESMVELVDLIAFGDASQIF
jgi:hypothetical protein